MASICLYLHVHQPVRIKKYSVFDIGHSHDYFDDENNKEILRRVARKSYLPTNKILLNMINLTDGRFKVSLSLTGTLLEQLEENAPEVIFSFQELVSTGHVELLSETYYHSLAYLYSKDEFRHQVDLHKKKLKELFDYEPKVFRNTELMFSNQMAKDVQDMGYKAILAEGADDVLGWQSPNFLYQVKNANKIKLLVRNYNLSDDISFRFSTRSWKDWPLTAEKFADWINGVNGNGEIINLFMDYETFGEHQWKETGIFDFLNKFPYLILSHPDNDFKTPSQIAECYQARGVLDNEKTTAWADSERDLSAWLGNDMQKKSVEYLYALEDDIKKKGDMQLIEDWRKLQTSDHFYYMCTKWFADGDVHKYFNPYETPYDCFISFMNIINDLRLRLAPNKISLKTKTSIKGRLSNNYNLINQHRQIYEK